MQQEWIELKVEDALPREIRRELRLYRREKGKRGHKYTFTDLLAVFAVDSDPIEHVVVTHNADPAWQHYWRHETRGWMLQQSYDTQDEAYKAVAAFEPYEPPPPPPNSKLNAHKNTIVGSWPDKPNAIKVKASSPWTGEQLHAIFQRLGMTVQKA